MRVTTLHPWNLTPTEAVALQRELASRVDVSTPLPRCDLIAGADISYNRFADTLYAAVVVLETKGWTVIETVGVVATATFPYRTGLLTFREAPAVLEAFAQVKSEPDAVMIDGQGFAHPRRIGIASHLGLWLDRPCVGCAKTRLIGEYENPGREKGSTSDLTHHEEVVGQMVRTKTGAKPVFVSVGHKIDLASSVRLVLEASRGYRIPEPTRQAHLIVNAMRRRANG